MAKPVAGSDKVTEIHEGVDSADLPGGSHQAGSKAPPAKGAGTYGNVNTPKGAQPGKVSAPSGMYGAPGKTS